MENVDKPKILVISALPPRGGGVAIQAELFINMLKNSGIYTKYANVTTWPILPSNPLLKIYKILTQPIITLIRSLNQINGIDTIVIFSSSFWGFMPVVIGVLLGITFNKKLIVNYLGGNAREFFKTHSRLVRFFLSRVNYVVVGSEFLGGEVDAIGSNSIIIPAIVDLKKWKFKVRKKFNPNILWIRQFSALYNPVMAIKVFSRIKSQIRNATITLIGGGKLKQELQNYASELGLEDIKIIDKIDQGLLQEYYNKHDYFINTTHVDNQPSTIIEAQACGLIVLSTEVGGISFMIKHGETGFLVDDADDKKMSEIIIKMIGKDNDLVNIVQKAKANLSIYDPNKVLDSWLSII